MTPPRERILEAELLRLRPLALEHSGEVLRYAAAKAIADNTFVPHPYSAEDAAEFISKTLSARAEDEGYTFALIARASGAFVGCMGIHLIPAHRRAEVGYWIGVPFWGRGYATDALRRLLRFGFEALALNRIEAGHFPQNPASGRVMRKAGMRAEGLRRGYVWHRDGYKDVAYYAILRAEWEAERVANM